MIHIREGNIKEVVALTKQFPEFDNPYFEVQSLRTYEAPNGDIKESDRQYLKIFDDIPRRFDTFLRFDRLKQCYYRL